MVKLTGRQHGDVANALMAFYNDKAHELEEAGEYFMAAIALAFGVETAILAYLLVEFGEDTGIELEIPTNINFADLIAAANEIEVLGARLRRIPNGHVEGLANSRSRKAATAGKVVPRLIFASGRGMSAPQFRRTASNPTRAR